MICPRTNSSATNCLWERRIGHVRDFPTIGIVKCASCGTIRHEHDLSEYVNYASGTMGESSSSMSREEIDRDNLRRAEALKALLQRHEMRKVLDFGCGNGFFLSALTGDFHKEGFEIDVQARQEALEFTHVYSSFEELEEEHHNYDVVTLFHVVEHLYDPKTTLFRLLQVLRPGGFLIIETPNADDALLERYQSLSFANFTFWSHHPYLYTKHSLSLLLESVGLKEYLYSGVQRYGLANHLYWLTKGRPGGHEIWKREYSEEVESAYAKDLLKYGVQDTLWFVAQAK